MVCGIWLNGRHSDFNGNSPRIGIGFDTCQIAAPDCIDDAGKRDEAKLLRIQRLAALHKTVTDSGRRLQSFREAGGADPLGVALGLMCNLLEMSGFEPAWTDRLSYIRRHRQGGTLFDFVEQVHGEFPDLSQFFPMSEVAVTGTVTDDSIGQILGNSRQLREQLGSGGVDVDAISHDTTWMTHRRSGCIGPPQRTSSF